MRIQTISYLLAVYNRETIAHNRKNTEDSREQEERLEATQRRRDMPCIFENSQLDAVELLLGIQLSIKTELHSRRVDLT